MTRLAATATNFQLPFFSKFENRKLAYDSGFYPLTQEYVARFASEMLASMEQVDLLASWVPGEERFGQHFSAASVTELANLAPFWSPQPWTTALAHRKVLVIHPFADTIRKQYQNNRQALFDREEILPRFDLDVLRAVQSLSGPDPRFSTWFEALDWMAQESLSRDFDVALVGCGAYGFPLSARLKKHGKRVVHLGGLLQILFGIRGNRWDSVREFRELYNSNWIRALPHEVPEGAHKLGQGSYW